MRSLVLCALILAASASALTAADPAPEPGPTWFLDASSPASGDDHILLASLQGLVNRDAPRLYLRTDFWVNPASDDFWARDLSEHKGITFRSADDLPSLIAHFRRQGLIHGLVLYPAGNHQAALAAAMLATRRHCLPVSDRALALQSDMLSGGERWTDDDLTRGGWRQESAGAKVQPDGLRIAYTGKGNGKSEYAYRVVRLDPAATPVLEVTVAAADGPWQLVVSNGDVRRVLIDADRPGQWRVNLPDHLPRLLPRAQLQFHVALKPDAGVTVRRVRLLGVDDQTATPLPPPADCFGGMVVYDDLRPRLGSEDAAAAWALEHLLAGSNRQIAFSAVKGWGNLIGMDLPLSRDAFVFHARMGKANADPLPVFDDVMRHLQAPAAVLGWAEPEWIYTYQVSRHGHFIQCSGAPNLSFWQHVPAAASAVLPQPARAGATLQDKHYVCIQFGDGDAPKNIVAAADLLPFRDKPYPVAQGMQPWLVDIAPALLEAYGRLGRANVSYFAGPSGAGYCNPSVMPNLPQYAAYALARMKRTGLSAIDLWDMATFDPAAVHQAFLAADVDHRVQAYFHAPVTPGQPAANFWLHDGTPVIVADHRRKARTLWGYAYRAAITADDIEQRILDVAARHEPPFFISHYGHMTSAVLDEVVRRLEASGRFVMVGADDLQRLAREAGELVAVPASTGFVSGQGVAVELTLHNPSGQPQPAGTVRWQIPGGWRCDEAEWRHPAIGPHAGVSRVVRFIASAQAEDDTAVLVFERDGRSWSRRVRLQLYAETVDLLGGSWASHDDATIAREGDATVVRGPRAGSYASQVVSVNFDRRPVLEMSLPVARGKWGVVMWDGLREHRVIVDAAVVGPLTVDLTESGWTGRREVEWRLYPAWSLGTSMTLDWMRLQYAGPTVSPAGGG